jgi:hypothetical protein
MERMAGSHGTFLLVGTAVSLLAACGGHYLGIYQDAVSENQQALQSLRPGMSASEVRALMGEGEVVRYKKIYLVDPWRSEAFPLPDGTDVLILFYVTQPAREYYHTEDHDLTPIVLEDDRVVGWGSSYLRRSNDRYQMFAPREQR